MTREMSWSDEIMNGPTAEISAMVSPLIRGLDQGPGAKN